MNKKIWFRYFAALLIIPIIAMNIPEITFANDIGQTAKSREVILNPVDYGADPSGKDDSAEAIWNTFLAAKEAKEQGASSVVVKFPKGEYHIYKDFSQKREYHTSNTNSIQYPVKSIGILIEDQENLTLDGGGSMFMMHGNMMALGVVRSKNIALKNFSWDFAVPTISEMTVVDANENYVDYYIPASCLFEVTGNTIKWSGGKSPYTGEEYWSETGIHRAYSVIAHNPEEEMTRAYFTNQGPFVGVTGIQKLDESTVRFTYNTSAATRKADGIINGAVFQLASSTVRETAGAFFWESSDLLAEDITVHSTHGFGWLTQMSHNVTYRRCNFMPREGAGRMTTSYADGIHASGASGDFIIEDCNFSNTHDDPINMHGTFTRVEQRIDDHTLKLKYIHGQQGGFPQFHVGDKVQFFTRDTLESTDGEAEYTVSEVVSNPGENGNDLRTMEIRFNETLPSNLSDTVSSEPKYVAENTTYAPSITIRRCTFKNVNTRGILVTSRQPVIIEDCTFLNMSMATTFFSNDSNDWYESGPIRDLTIRNNTFYIKSIGRTSWNVAPAIYFHPVTKGGGLPDSSNPIHKNINIEGNTFYMDSDCAVYAESVENLRFADNKILRYNPDVKLEIELANTNLNVGDIVTATLTKTGNQNTGKNGISNAPDSNHDNLFEFYKCKDVVISNNTYDDGLKMTAVDLGGNIGLDVQDSEITVTNAKDTPASEAVSNVVFASSDPAIASVDADGNITAKSAGTATVFAYYELNGSIIQSNHIDVTVNGSGSVTPPTGISIAENNNLVVTTGSTQQYTTTGAVSGVTWSVENPLGGSTDCAEIDASGILTPKKSGVVVVKATVSGVSDTKTAIIQVPSSVIKGGSITRESSSKWESSSNNSVTITLEPGDLYQGDNTVKNLFLFDLPAGVTGDDMITSIHASGLPVREGGQWDTGSFLLYKDDNNYVSIGKKSHYNGFAYVKENNGTAVETGGNAANDSDISATLAFVKNGNDINMFALPDGGSSWVDIGKISDSTVGNDYKIGFAVWCNKDRGNKTTFSDLRIGKASDYGLSSISDFLDMNDSTTETTTLKEESTESTTETTTLKEESTESTTSKEESTESTTETTTLKEESTESTTETTTLKEESTESTTETTTLKEEPTESTTETTTLKEEPTESTTETTTSKEEPTENNVESANLKEEPTENNQDLLTALVFSSKQPMMYYKTALADDINTNNADMPMPMSASDTNLNSFISSITAFEIVVINTPPAVSNLHLEPVNIGEDAKIEYTYTDNEGQAEKNTLYHWLLIDSSGSGNIIEKTFTNTNSFRVRAKGYLECTIYPIDSAGLPGESKSVVTSMFSGTVDYSLGSIALNGTKIKGFSPDNTVYDVFLPKNLNKIELSYTSFDVSSGTINIKINGTDIAPSPNSGVLELSLAGNEIIVLERLDDIGNAQKTYTLNLHHVENSNTEITNIEIPELSFSESTPLENNYYIKAPAAQTTATISVTADTECGGVEIFRNASREKLNVTPSGNTYSADINITAGLNSFFIESVGKDGITRKRRIINIVREASQNADLSSLTVNGTPVEGFSADKTQYRIDTNDTKISVSAQKADSSANVSITVNGVRTEGSSISNAALQTGLNKIRVAVEADDVAARKVYDLQIVNDTEDNANLLNFSIDGIIISPVFDQNKTEYTAQAYQASISVRASAQNKNALVSIEGNGNSVEKKGEEAVLSVPVYLGQNSINIKVTAADGIAEKTYKINLNGNDTVYLSDLNWESASVGYGSPQKDLSCEGNPIRLATKENSADPTGAPVTYNKGLGGNATASFVYDLTGKGFTRFQSYVGIDYANYDAEYGSIKFTVLLDGAEAFNSGVMTQKTPQKAIDLDITGVGKIELIADQVENNWNDHADWADTKLSLELPQRPNTFTVAIDSLTNGTITSSHSAASPGETVTLTVTPSNGYQLKEGSLKANGTAVTLTNGVYSFVMPSENVTVTAEFEPISEENEFTITVSSLANGTVTSSKVTSAPGETITLTVTPSNGYRLKPGSLKANGTAVTLTNGAYTFVMPSENVTVTAEFEPISEESEFTITVSNLVNGVISLSQASAMPGETITLTVTPNTGYQLKEGSLKANGTAVTLTNGSYSFVMPSENVTVTAEFEPISEESEFTVSFNTNGGSSVASQNVKENEKVIKPADPIREGYNFLGWYKDSELTKMWNFNTDIVTENITLYAKWESSSPNAHKITVSNLTNGNVSLSQTTSAPGETVTVTVIPNNGYQLKEGSLKANDTVITLVNGVYTFVMPSEDVVITAEFEPISSEDMFNVDFNSKGGSSVESQKVPKDGKITKPSDPKRPSYIFLGWYRDTSLTSLWDFENDTVNKNTTLYAKWRRRSSDSSSGGSSSSGDSTNNSNNETRETTTETTTESTTETTTESVKEPTTESTTESINKPNDDSANNEDSQNSSNITFEDAKNHWASPYIQYVTSKGLFQGISKNNFAPDVVMSRGMLVTVLYRLAGEPEINSKNIFEDVKDDIYYADAVTWASSNSVVNGVGNDKFLPDGAVTREQIAVMLMNFAQQAGLDVSERQDLSNYKDSEQISPWAKDAMQWAVANKIISGTSKDTLSPRSEATRAQVATMLYNFESELMN